MANIFVGPEERHFHVHKKLLCERALCFNSRFTSGMKGRVEGAGDFPENPRVEFSYFLGWLYHGKLSRSEITRVSQNEGGTTWPHVALYCLASKFLMLVLADRCMGDYRNDFRNVSLKENVFPLPEQIKEAYENSMLRSPIRRFLAHILAFWVVGGLEFFEH